jgi:hypothetical protein
MAGSVGTAREAADDCVRAAIGVARSSISLFFLTGRISADHVCGQIRDLARPPEVCNGQTMEGGKVAKALPRLPATQEKADEPWFGIAYASAIRGRLHLTAISVFFVYVLFAISCGAATAFNPIRERLVVSTDMTPIDIEVVGSTSLVPRLHKLIPELVVRFRLERAYVGLYAEREPGFEIFNIGVDLETRSPMSLFETAILGARFGKDIPGIPRLLPEELRRRNIRLSIHSDDRAEYLRRFSETIAPCRSQAVENGLWLYERKTDCPGLGAQRFGRIGQLEDTLLTKIECDEALPSSFARCQTEFPFEGFAVRLNFDRDLLPRWREVISFSAKFLESKQYRPIESRGAESE